MQRAGKRRYLTGTPQFPPTPPRNGHSCILRAEASLPRQLYKVLQVEGALGAIFRKGAANLQPELLWRAGAECQWYRAASPSHGSPRSSLCASVTSTAHQPIGLLAASTITQEKSRTSSTQFMHLGAEQRQNYPAEDAVGLKSFPPCSSWSQRGSRPGMGSFQ